ncbi:hypothetical protein [Streptomyces sp. NPDC001980]|uniref:hypothetical protein n=1 Tax=Streptomyces sp. NPDC001980 TaxID=3157126 RepID=UPI0033185916
MAPALIHAPQPFITPGQGIEAGAGRKGVRRTPKSALAALTLAYTAGAGAVTTTHGEAAADPRDQLATLRRELPARVELVEGSYLKAVDAAHTLMTDFEEARRLRVQLGEEPLPAEQRIEWMEKLAKVRAAAQASVTTLEQVEALILKV